MRLSRRSTSSAPVTTRRTRRMSLPLRGRAAASSQSAGVSGKSTRWTELSSPGKRSSQTSSMVKGRIGASQVDEPVEERVEHGARGAAARAVGGVAVERVLADVEVEGREVDGARTGTARWNTPLEVVGRVARRAPRGRARPAGAGPSGRARASSAGATRSASVEAVEGAEQEAQGVAQPAVAVGGALQDLRARCAGRRCSRTAPPRGAGCRRRTA